MGGDFWHAQFAPRYESPRPLLARTVAANGVATSRATPHQTRIRAQFSNGGRHENSLWSRDHRELYGLQSEPGGLFLPPFLGCAQINGRSQSPYGYACRSCAVCRRPDAARHIYSLFREREAVHYLKRREGTNTEAGGGRRGAGLERCYFRYELRNDRRN